MKPKYIIIHHSAGPITQTAEAINQYHKNKWNFKSSLGGYAGYQYIIEHTGRVTQWRADNEAGAHCTQEYMNFNSIGICVVGWFDQGHDDLPTEKQQKALSKLLNEKMTQWSIPSENVKFHRDYAPKSCPGHNFTRQFLNKLLKMKYYNIDSTLKKPLKLIYGDFDDEKEKDHEKVAKVLTRYIEENEATISELNNAILKGKEVLKQAKEELEIKTETIDALEDDFKKDKAEMTIAHVKEKEELKKQHAKEIESLKKKQILNLDELTIGQILTALISYIKR